MTVILDTGADISILPLSFKGVDRPLSRTNTLWDAQGCLMRRGWKIKDQDEFIRLIHGIFNKG